MTSDTSNNTSSGGKHEAAGGQRLLRVVRWVRGRWASGRLLARQTLRHAGPAGALGVVLLSGLLGQLAAAGIGIVPVAHAAGGGLGSRPGVAQGKPNLVNPRLGATSIIHPWHAPAMPQSSKPVTPTPQIGRGLDASGAPIVPMKPGSVALSAAAAAHFVGSDKRLEVSVPAGAVTAADLAAAGGKLTLLVSQVAPASGSSAGGDGHISLGMYLLQLVDAHGRRVTHGLRKAITVTLHYGPKGIGGDPSSGAFLINMPLPRGAALAPAPAPAGSAAQIGQQAGQAVASAKSGSAATSANAPGTAVGPAGAGLGTYRHVPAMVDLKAHTLSATVQPGAAETSVGFNTDSPVASFGGPDPYSVDLNAGGLTATYPIDVPSGPGGLTPPLQLTYSSAGVSEQHNPQSAAPWVGEGWNLSLGSISWAEHQVSTGIWESEWKLNDPYGTSADLIPPDITVSSYWDDTVNYPCDTGTTGKQPTHSCPVQFQTSPETHANVVMYLNANTAASGWLPDGAGARPPCWRVFLPNGIMEEFGCTQDSLQWYFVPGIGDEIASWNLDLISDPQGNQIHITYTHEVESKSFGNYGTHQYVRDVVPATVEYDSPTCQQNATVYADNYCNGTAAPSLWKPLMRVQFNASHSVQHVYGSSCAANGSLRCDDPVDISNGLDAPQVQSAWVLNSIAVQVQQSGTWQTLRTYNLSYDQTPNWTIPDPVTGEGESVAGHLNLTRIQEVGSDGTTTLPPVTLHYTYEREIYEDSSALSPPPAPSAGCGFSWNTGYNGSGCLLWSESEGGNGYYLDTMDNGLGMEETYHWAAARNNTHGGYNGANNDPLSCDGHESSGYPCDEADDQAWDRIVLTERDSTVDEDWVGDSTSPLTTTTTYHYLLTTFPSNTQLCGDCTASMYWGSQTDVDYQDFYNGRFMGFAEADVNQADGSVQKYHYDTTTGWGVYDTGQVPCGTNPSRQPSGQPPCHASPWWNIAAAGHGRTTEVDDYDTNGTTLLAKQTTGYTLTCPPSGVNPTPTHNWNGNNYGTFDNMNVAMVDLNNPVAACEIHATQTDSYTYDGSSSAVHSTTTATYDTYGRLSSVIADSHGGGGALGSPTQIATHYDYTWNDAVTQYPHSATGTYIVDRQAVALVEDTSAQPTVYRCVYTSYDGHNGAVTGQQSFLTMGEATAQNTYTNCGAQGGLIDTTTTYDSYGNVVASDDADAVADDSSHIGCLPGTGSTQYTTCTLIDPTFEALPTATANAVANGVAQTTSISYGNAGAPSLGGFGLWPTSVTDPNLQVTSTTYDALGRTTSVTLPGEASGKTTSSTTYTIWCTQGTNGGTSGAQAPCVEVDTTQRLDKNTTVTSRAFYDGFGRLVETRSPAPGGEDVVAFVAYDIMGRPMQQSVRFEVAAYTGGPGAAAFAPFPTTVAATQTFYDGLGRVGETLDPQSNKTQYFRGPVCGAFSDSACYESVLSVDPLAHEQQTLTDAFGRTAYAIAFSGNGTSGNPYAYYAVTKTTYDYAGDVTKVLEPDGSHTLTYTYDDAGRVTAMSDPDRGSETYAYDANGNLTQSVDARGSAGTVYLGYDGLNRPLWRNTTNSATGAYVTYTYDQGTFGAGRLSEEQFNAGKSLGVGSYSYTYDARGQTTALSEVVDGTTYPFSFGYNDAGQPTSVGYSDGTYLCDAYDSASGWLSTVSVTGASASSGCSTSGQTTLASGLAYSGDAGAAGLVTSASVNPGNGTTYAYAASYDEDLRLLSSSLSASGSTLYQVQAGYDAASNVTAVDTTLPGGVTDNQSFCYDEQNRLTWASSSSGTGPCGIVNNGGSLTAQGAKYTATYAYDTLDRLTSGPAGSTYTYGDSAHLHAATGTSGGYSATYDAAGDMTCRAPTSTTTCTSSSPTGAGLTYDNEGQLVSWTSALNGSPTASTAAFAYDGEGARVALKTTTGTGIVTTTDYLLGGLEEQQTVGGSVRPSSTLTEYYPLPGIGTAVRVTTSSSSTLSYLAGDQLGSVSAALSTSGTVTAQALYSPYGTLRYSSGSMPTAHGYTGQLADGMTGLDYYGARYYDPTLGQFAQADSVLDGLNRYAYVSGNPTTATDPSGHAQCYECVGAAAGGDWFNSGGVGPGTTVLYDLAEYTLGLVSIYHDVKTILNPDADLATKLGAFGDVLVQGGMDVLMLTGEGEELRGAELSGRTADELTRAAVKASEWTDDAAKAGLVADDGLNVPGRVAEEDAAKAAAAEAAGDDGSRPHGGGSPGDEGPGHGGGPSGPSGGDGGDVGGSHGGGGDGGPRGGASSGDLPPGRPTATPPDFTDPTQSPGPDWQWKSSKSGDPGTVPGNWYNPQTREQWNPHLVGSSHGPHWDYAIKGVQQEWRWLPDGTFQPKYKWLT